MIIYKCLFCQDELLTDCFKIKEVNDGIFFEVDGKRVTRKDGFDDALIGANASAEEEQQANEDSAVTGIDVILNHKLVPTEYSKKDYIKHVKDYVKRVKAHLIENNPDRVEKFTATIEDAVKRIVCNFKDFEFFTGESMEHTGMLVAMNYREDGATPYFLFFKDGLEIEKC